MAQNPSNFRTWSSSSEAANLSYKLGNSNIDVNVGSAVSKDMDQLAWQQLERNSQSYRITVRSSVPRFESPSGGSCNDQNGRRRRASESGTPDGWVAFKNLISERKRREKFKKGLITLRELVPMFNMKMDKISILTDAISHLQDLKRKVEMLESTYSIDEDRVVDLKAVEVAKNSCRDLGTRNGTEMEGENQKDSSLDASFCSELFDDSVVRCNYETSSSSRDWNLHQIQLDVTKLEHGVYKLDLICVQESGVLVQLSQAIEAFVIEVVHSSIVVITSTKATCTFVVKMSSWIDMTLEDIAVDIKMLLRMSGLQIS